MDMSLTFSVATTLLKFKREISPPSSAKCVTLLSLSRHAYLSCAHERWILEVPGTLQGAIMRRKSPKRQAVNQLFEELVSFSDLLACPNFSIEVVSIQEEQLRRYSRRWRGKRRTWRIVERRLLTVLDRYVFNDPSDLWQLIPPTLPDPFETSHLASVLGHSRWFAQKIAYCLRQSGVITAIGKKGNSLVYSRLTPCD